MGHQCSVFPIGECARRNGTNAFRFCILSAMSLSRNAIRQWIDGILAAQDWSAAELAAKAKVSPSTISRLRAEGGATAGNIATIEKIAEAAGVPIPGESPAPRRNGGFSENDAAEFKGAPPRIETDVDRGTALMVVNSAALEHLGVLPGDVIEVDLRAEPTAGDFVVAQIYGADGTGARTVIRRFFPPFLVGASSDERYAKPRLIDDSVRVAGVIRRILRELSSAAA